MINLLRAELFKLRKSTAFKVCFLLSCASAMALTYFSHAIAIGSFSNSISGSASGLSEFVIISLLGSLLTGIMVCSDFETKTIHDAIACGKGRSSVVLSKVLVYVLIITLLFVPYELTVYYNVTEETNIENIDTTSNAMLLFASIENMGICRFHLNTGGDGIAIEYYRSDFEKNYGELYPYSADTKSMNEFLEKISAKSEATDLESCITQTIMDFNKNDSIKSMFKTESQVWGKNSPRLRELINASIENKSISVYPKLLLNTNTDIMIAKQLCHILENKMKGIFHLTSEDIINYKDLYTELIAKLSFSNVTLNENSNEEGYFALQSERYHEFPQHLRITNRDVIQYLTN